MVRKWKAYVAYAFLACSAAGLNIIADSQADGRFGVPDLLNFGTAKMR